MGWGAGDSSDQGSLPLTGEPGTFFGPTITPRRGIRSLFSLRSRRRAQTDLIAALNDVAAAVSSTTTLDTLLDTIVERSKSITDTDKAALALTYDESDQIDVETLVVRGSRAEHPQEWWSDRLPSIASTIFSTGRTHIELDREQSAWLLGAPIRIKDRPVGLLLAINSRDRRFNEEQVDFLAILGAFAATAIENARLAEESRYVLLASERDRIAREMHDGIAQSLFSVALGLELCRKQILRDPMTVAGRLEELQEAVDVSRSELRRFIYDLRPIKLQELGLIGAIEYWIHQVTTGKPVRCHINVTGTHRRLRPATEAALYGVAKEAISNIMKHAMATRFEVAIDYLSDTVRLIIIDDGCGFDVEAVRGDGGLEGIGLRSIGERMSREGGTVDIRSVPQGGTRIEVTVRG